MYKSILAIAAALLIGFGSTDANAQSSEEQLLGAIAGGYLGSTVGKGDGRKAATVIGAIIGYRMGEQILSSNDYRDHRREFIALDHNDFYSYCRSRVPHSYVHRHSLRDNWIRGCMDRMEQRQYELDREAYEDGYGSPN